MKNGILLPHICMTIYLAKNSLKLYSASIEKAYAFSHRIKAVK